MRYRFLLSFAVLIVSLCLVLSGCIIIKGDRGLHKGHYKQERKAYK